MEKGFFKKNKVLGINLLYILSIIPVIIFAFYKNGIVVWKNGFMSLFLATQYIVIPIIIILFSYVFEAYYYMGIKKEENTNSVFNSIVPYVNALCYLVCGPTNYLWLTVPMIIGIDVIIKFLDNKFSINQIALFKCLLYIVLLVMGVTSNANLYENSLSSSITDPSLLFIGNGIGEIGTTSTLCVLIGYVILLFNSYYKKDIPLICFLGYGLVSIVMYFVGGVTFNDILVNTFTSGFMFLCIFVTSLSTATPVVRGGKIIYSLIVGMLCAVMVHALHFNIGMYIVVLICSLLTPIFNKFKLSLD